MGAGVVQCHVSVGHAFAVVAGFGLGDFLLGGEQGGIALDHEVGGRLAGLRHVLRDLRHAPGRRHVEVARIFMQRAVEQAEQRGFAGAVAPDQADLFAGVEGDGGVVEQHLGATTQGDVLEGDHELRLWYLGIAVAGG